MKDEDILRMANESIKRVMCDRVGVMGCQFTSLRSLRDSMTVQAQIDHLANSLVVQLYASMPAILDEVIDIHRSWPATWWDAVKERWYPKWALRRWPVKYQRIDVHRPVYKAVCTHLPMEGNGPHIQFLYNASVANEQDKAE